MKTKIYLWICMLLILISPVFGWVWCEQEFANVSTSCKGLGGGSYEDNGLWVDEFLVRDGDWNTYSDDTDNVFPYPITNVTYQKYVFAENTSLFQMKFGCGGVGATTKIILFLKVVGIMSQTM